MLKKIGAGITILFVLLVVTAGVFLYSDDLVTITKSPAPAGGLTEANYLNRSENNGQSVLSYPLATTHGLKPNGVLISEGPPLGG